jgi:putative ABC transport system ATP-binding protein
VTDNPLIETRDLTKIYFKKGISLVRALNGVNVEVFAGEFLALIGRSGSGKTTLLNLIGALDRPTSGEVFFEGKNLGEYTNRNLALLRGKKIGFIFQTFNLLPGLTVFENVESALVHSGLSREKMAEKVGSWLSFFELNALSNRLPLELSVGQQQKVAIARALVKDPVLVLADEPTGEMDPMSGMEIMTKLVELNKKSGVTTVVVSHAIIPHNPADRTLFIKCGKIVPQKESGY